MTGAKGLQDRRGFVLDDQATPICGRIDNGPAKAALGLVDACFDATLPPHVDFQPTFARD